MFIQRFRGAPLRVSFWQLVQLTVTARYIGRSQGTVMCILVGMKSFPRFWRNHPYCRNKWYLIWKPLVFSLRWRKKKKKILKKKIQNGRLKKTSFSSSTNSQYFFMKISWIGRWFCRIDWCEGHWCGSTYMVVRLSDISSKTGKKCIFCVFRLFLSLCQTASRPHRLSHTNALRINQFY